MYKKMTLKEFKEELKKNIWQIWCLDSGIPENPRSGFECFTISAELLTIGYPKESHPEGDMHVAFKRGYFYVWYKDVTFHKATPMDLMIDYTKGARWVG